MDHNDINEILISKHFSQKSHTAARSGLEF